MIIATKPCASVVWVLFTGRADHAGIFAALVVQLRNGPAFVKEGMMLRAPVVDPLVAQFAMARFCRMLGTLLGASVPLVQALNVARKSIGNQILVDAVSESITRVSEGTTWPESGELPQSVPGSVLEMIAVAEESKQTRYRTRPHCGRHRK